MAKADRIRPQGRGAAPTMAASIVAGIVAYALSRGVEMARITEATGLQLADLLDPDARLPEHHVQAVWRLLQAEHPGEAVSLGFAEAVPPSFFGPLAFAVRHAEDLRSALLTFVRYRKVLSSSLHVALEERPPKAALIFSHPTDLRDGGLGAEGGIAVGWRMIQGIFGVQAAGACIEFAHAPFGPDAAYEAYFETPVRFRAGRNAILLPLALLDAPVPGRDMRQHLFIEARLDGILSATDAEESSAELRRVRDAVAQNAARCEYGAEALAGSLAMSLRSLQRLARRHGTSVRALLEETREARARQLLTDPSLTIDAVAFLLGYASESAFRRAFHRWTGHPPSHFR